MRRRATRPPASGHSREARCALCLGSVSAKVVVITGVSRGLGRALFRECLARGHEVAGCDRAPDGMASLCTERSPAAKSLLRICDVTRIDALRNFCSEVEEQLGPVDIWINCAGIARGGSRFDELDEGEFEAMIAVNLAGTAAVCREVLARMRRRGRGAIYNIVGAGADYRQVPGMLGYATTKAALQFFTDGFALEARGSGVAIGSVSPGLVLTEAVAREFERLPPDTRPARARVMNRIADTPEVSASWIMDCVLANKSEHVNFVRLTRGARLARRLKQWFREGGQR